jgi:hypothetical protein
MRDFMQDLIARLDTLYNVYTQQLKNVNALTAALKNIIGVSSKLTRCLEDYAPVALNAEMITQAQQAVETNALKEQTSDILLPELRQQAKFLTATIGALKDARVALNNDPIDVVRLDRAVTVLQQGGIELEVMEALTQELEEAQAQLGNLFGVALNKHLAEMGINMGGMAPRFEAGRFELVANFVARKVSIYYGKMEIAKNVPISVEAVIKAYRGAFKSIVERNENGQAWIGQFYTAYETARRLSEKSSARVNIVDCYFQMVLLRQNRTFYFEPSKRTMTDYSRAQFIYDFVEFMALGHQGQDVHIHTATKSQTDSASKSMWMVDGSSPHDGRYVADIEFVKGH